MRELNAALSKALDLLLVWEPFTQLGERITPPEHRSPEFNRRCNTSIKSRSARVSKPKASCDPSLSYRATRLNWECASPAVPQRIPGHRVEPSNISSTHRTSPLGMFSNDTNPSMVLSAHQSQDAAAKLGLTIQSIAVHDLTGFDSAFAVVEKGRVAALLTLIDPFTREYRQRIVDFAAQQHLPAIYNAREFVQSGGLISYGPSLLAMQHRLAEYVVQLSAGNVRFWGNSGHRMKARRCPLLTTNRTSLLRLS